MTRVKICGITNVEDALLAVDAGADAIGLVFYPPSPRYVTPEIAARIVEQLPPFVTSVGLFVNHDAQRVGQICAEVSLDLLQFHGDETPQACALPGKRFIKALRMAPDMSVSDAARPYERAAALLLDSFDIEKYGGSGESFDWRRVPEDLDKPLILAGGLDCSNVDRAIEMVRPYAVDVSSGVESAPGRKSASKLNEFITRVKNCE